MTTKSGYLVFRGNLLDYSLRLDQMPTMTLIHVCATKPLLIKSLKKNKIIS